MTRLNSIYARDMLSFQDHAKSLECRQVSRWLNATIVNSPVSIPARRRLERLDFILKMPEENRLLRIDSDGYANWVGNFMRMQWKNVLAEWDCRREELKESARDLIGKCIVPAHPTNSVVMIDIFVGSGKSIFLWALNELTAKTAFGILHLLEHLRDAYFKRIFSCISNNGTRASLALNPLITQLLSMDGRPFKLHAEYYWMSSLPPAIDTLLAELAHLKIGHAEVSKEQNFEVGLDFARQGRPYCEMLTLIHLPNDAFNAALQYFQTTLPRIGRRVVTELILSWIFAHSFWPAGLPPKREMKPLGYDDGRRVGFFRKHFRLRGSMTNASSGEHFDVEVLCQSENVEAKDLDGMILRFR